MSRRVRKKSFDLGTGLLSKQTEFYCNGPSVIEERERDADAGGNLGIEHVARQFIDGANIDEHILQDIYDNSGNISQTLYYCANYRNDTSVVTNANGDVQSRFFYDTYGKTFKLNAQNQTEEFTDFEQTIWTFQGRRVDKETGLVYFRARHFSTSLGRFLQRDAKGYIDGMNLYAGFGSNPQIFRDAMGTEKTMGEIAEDFGSPSPMAGAAGGAESSIYEEDPPVEKQLTFLEEQYCYINQLSMQRQAWQNPYPMIMLNMLPIVDWCLPWYWWMAKQAYMNDDINLADVMGGYKVFRMAGKLKPFYKYGAYSRLKRMHEARRVRNIATRGNNLSAKAIVSAKSYWRKPGKRVRRLAENVAQEMGLLSKGATGQGSYGKNIHRRLSPRELLALSEVNKREYLQLHRSGRGWVLFSGQRRKRHPETGKVIERGGSVRVSESLLGRGTSNITHTHPTFHTPELSWAPSYGDFDLLRFHRRHGGEGGLGFIARDLRNGRVIERTRPLGQIKHMREYLSRLGLY